MAAPLISPPAVRSGDASSAAEQLAAMAAELQQRDQLIEALTERLEEAAEQLDRVHRTGSTRGPAGGSATMPAEALEYLYSVAERTDQMVGEWGDVQAAAILNRLDARIDSLVELLSGNAPTSEAPAPAYVPPTFLPQGSTPAPAPVAVASDETPITFPAPDETPLELKDPPALIDDAELNPEKLHAAIREREDYISYLIRELNRRQSRQPIDWAALQQVPEEFAARLRQLETRLQSDLQKEDLNLSLERARLARERAELERIRGRLEKEIRMLGKGAVKDAEPAKINDDTTSGLRKLFGKKK